MSMGLTSRQRDLLDWLSAELGRCDASFSEMMLGIGCTSKSSITRLVCALEERGFVRRLPGRARSLELLKPARAAPRLLMVAGHHHWDLRAAANRQAWRDQLKEAA